MSTGLNYTFNGQTYGTPSTGGTTTGSTTTTKKDSDFDWLALIGTIGGIAGSFFGSGSNNNATTSNRKEEDNSMLWIIAGVFGAIILLAILVMAFKK
jgi:uncharacterized membrane protein YeaQ/YmgE (transglycosylase-associated protein family)